MKLFVRINPRTHTQKFRRCGLEFTQGWQEVDADAATEARLRGEQMLEVMDAPGVGSEPTPEGTQEGEAAAEPEPKAKPSRVRKASA
ncbi:MAG: hypothetical protein FWG52_04040 [Proteobacteria bacterium]|nr:hypothetical protein [Pseudomonadota bacterium]